MKNFLFALFAALSFAFPADSSVSSSEKATYSVKLLLETNDNSCVILNHGITQQYRLLKTEEQVIVQRYPSVIEEHVSQTTEDVVEFFGFNIEQVWDAVQNECGQITKAEVAPEPEKKDEVFEIVHNGDPSNRIDVVFMGDGYTSSQRQNHIDDMERLVFDMFEGVTFNSYLPLFNIWGVYRESNEEGIGTHGQARDTAYRLYRQGTELRGITTGNAPGARAACTATGTNACDYPTLIGHDPFYGGRGGEFTVSTSSETSGTVVLRHEFGHTMAQVGEEYDGGGYRGANASPTVAGLTWRDWLTNQTAEPVAEQSVMTVQVYAWYDLAEGAYTIDFVSPGGYPRWNLRFSVSGCETTDSFEVTLDGVALPWESNGLLDRGFYDFFFDDRPLSPGAHRFVFRQLRPPVVNQIRQLCQVNVREYAAEPLYHLDDPTYIGSYPTYNSVGGNPSYRPMDEFCLMRHMQSANFCPICKESIWKQFFMRMSVIDDIEVVPIVGESVHITARMVGLGEFRKEKIDFEERYLYSWYRNGVHQEFLDGLFTWIRPISGNEGNWELRVVFETDEVRWDPNNILHFTRSFVIS